MARFLLSLITLLPIVAVAQSTEPAGSPTPESATRPNSIRRSRAAEALGLLGEVNLQNEADVQRVVEVVERQVLGDARLMPCDLHVKLTGGKAALEGYCLLAEQKSVVLEDLKRVGLVDIDDRAAVGSIGGDRPFAIVQNRAISVTAKPGRSEQLTVWPAAATLFLLQQQGDSFLALGPDGYAGFVGAARVRRVTADELKNAKTKPTESGLVTQNDGTKPNPTTLTDAKSSGTKPNPSSSPDAENDGTKPKPATLPDAKNGETKPPLSSHGLEIDSAISSAAKLLGTKYVWGGIDASGVDCSGLTRGAFQSIGMNLPRDADQQALVGRLVATRWYRDDLQRGDLLFFVGRRGTVSHVALCLGHDEFIEAADGTVQVSSFDPDSPNYRSKRVDSFCFAKRILE